MKLFEPVLSLIYPPKCLLCQDFLPKGTVDLCPFCQRRQPEYTARFPQIPFLHHRLAVWYYEIDVRASLVRFKFYKKRHYAKGYARFLGAKILRELSGKFDVIVYVPVSRRRKQERGYDQVKILAMALSRELKVPVVHALKKIRHTPPQSGMKTEAERKANVLGAYRVRKPKSIAGKRVLLIDDIITTGATISECARMLLNADAAVVHGAAVAAARTDNNFYRENDHATFFQRPGR